LVKTRLIRFQKRGGIDLYFEKKMVWESLKNTHALAVEENYGSNYKLLFFPFLGEALALGEFRSDFAKLAF